MSKNITVSLPDELFERVQAVKESINVSGICQEALEKETEKQELLKKGKNMTRIEKLREQKLQYDQRYFDEGKQDGIKDAEDMDYEELLAMTCEDNIYQTEVYFNYLKDEIEGKKRYEPAFNEEKYLEGWVAGVIESYEQIKDEL